MSSSRLCSIFLVFLTLSSLFGASLRQEPMFTDPYASEKLLEGRNFLRDLAPGEAEPVKDLRISLVTTGRGDPLYSWFGHSGLVATNTSNNKSVMYDYGIFNFKDDFYRTFVLGRLSYEVWATSTPARIDLAIKENRDMTEIILDLPLSARLEVLKFLNYNIQEGPNTYLYHQYEENCSTRLRDIIDKATDGQLRAWSTSIPMEETIRMLVGRYTRTNPAIEWILDFLQSGSIDKPITLWEAMFLPQIFESALLGFTYINTEGNVMPLTTGRQILNMATGGIRERPLDSWTSYTIRFTLFGIGTAILTILIGGFQKTQFPIPLRRARRFVYGTINFLLYTTGGGLALLLTFMMIVSNHDVTYFNENIIFINPYLMLMGIQALRGGFGHNRPLVRFRRANMLMVIITITWMVMKLVFIDHLIQQNWHIVLTVLPLYLANSTIPFERLLIPRHRTIDDSDS